MKEHRLDPVGRPDAGVLVGDARLALEIAEFVADRAQYFVDQECQSWAVTDFGVWAVLAGQSPKLSLGLGPVDGMREDRLH